MKKSKAKVLAVLLAFSLVLQFCVFSSQSAWAGQADVTAASEQQMQGVQEDIEEASASGDPLAAAPVEDTAEESTDSEKPAVSGDASVTYGK